MNRRLLAAVLVSCLAGAACQRDAPTPADGRTPVWLDISPAYGDPPRDPGDALALLQAFGSGRLAVRGVSITFGNVALVRGYPVAQELMSRLDTGLLRPWRGASSPEERAAPTEATELLEEALGREPLTILATGPLTTVASVLSRQPALASRVERVVLVAGHRPLGDVADADRRAAADANVLADAESLQQILQTAVDLTLVPALPETPFGFGAPDLDRLDRASGPIGLIAPSARAWLQAVARRDATSEFPIPALVAVDVAAHPGEFRCEAAAATLTTERGSPRLAIGPPGQGRLVTWCHTPDPGARERILTDLLAVRGGR